VTTVVSEAIVVGGGRAGVVEATEVFEARVEITLGEDDVVAGTGLFVADVVGASVVTTTVVGASVETTSEVVEGTCVVGDGVFGVVLVVVVLGVVVEAGVVEAGVVVFDVVVVVVGEGTVVVAGKAHETY